MIAGRLRVGAMPSSSAHPDADLLTAFAERSLSERERAQVLEHLAQCAVCREVVYLAQPELEEATPGVSAAPIRWYSWRRLQWAALAASVSVVIALAVLVRENPERSALSGRLQTGPASPATAPAQVKNDAVEAYSYSAPSIAENEKAERREFVAGSPEKQEKPRTEAKVVGGRAQAQQSDWALSFEARDQDYFTNLGPGATKSATSDLRNLANPFDKEATTKQSSTTRGDEGTLSGYTYGYTTEKDAKGVNVATKSGVTTTHGAADQTTLFDLQQQKTESGPYSNMNVQNSGANIATNGMYLDRAKEPSAPVAANQPAAAPPPPAAAPANAEDSLKRAEVASAEVGRTMGGPVMRRSAPTRPVVPADDGQKKKLETIPAHATPPGTEETVAVAGRPQDADAARAANSGTVLSDSVSELSVTGRNLATLTPGVAPASAITGWRVHHGRLLGRLYGIWHNLILRKLQTAGETSVTEISSAFESMTQSEANSRSETSLRSMNKAAAVSQNAAVAPQHFTAVTSLGADVWAVELVSEGQSQLVVHHSRDAGITWQPSILAAGSLKPNVEADIKFKDAEQGEITLPSGEKWQTSDGGAHWNSVK
jgi:hypothetical protein